MKKNMQTTNSHFFLRVKILYISKNIMVDLYWGLLVDCSSVQVGGGIAAKISATDKKE